MTTDYAALARRLAAVLDELETALDAPLPPHPAKLLGWARGNVREAVEWLEQRAESQSRGGKTWPWYVTEDALTRWRAAAQAPGMVPAYGCVQHLRAHTIVTDLGDGRSATRRVVPGEDVPIVPRGVWYRAVAEVSP